MQDSRAETYKPLMKEVKEDLSSWECSRTQLAAHQLKDPMPRDRCWVNGKVALLRKPQSWGEDGLTSHRTNAQAANQGPRAIKR